MSNIWHTVIGRGRTKEKQEAGQYLVLFAILLALAFLLMGLVFDGGRLYQGYRQAQLTADMAAQAASQCIDTVYFEQTNQVRLDEQLAATTARSYVLANRSAGTEIERITVTRNRVTVGVRLQVEMSFMRLLGINQAWVRGESTTRPHYGIEHLWQ
ncbi:MAG: hypothetical protein KKA73_09280 [Chloroflexi bacterium]|nr:hypothetical protein [Chloroflexota bacterium]